MDKYILTIGEEEEYIVEANLAEASAPIYLDGNSTPFQTADCQHCEEIAASILFRWIQSEGGLRGFDGLPSYEIKAAEDED